MVIVMAMNIRFGEGVLRKREAMNGSFTSYIYIYICMGVDVGVDVCHG